MLSRLFDGNDSFKKEIKFSDKSEYAFIFEA